ncbi:hypothetical protein OAN22_00285 [Alphaproteobacteria bacterium]|nr:hypothetical protein [Alphaproteobacteria bacterium]
MAGKNSANAIAAVMIGKLIGNLCHLVQQQELQESPHNLSVLPQRRSTFPSVRVVLQNIENFHLILALLMELLFFDDR